MEEIEVYQHVMGNYYRKRKENGKFSYYVLQYCVNCGQQHLTDKYKPGKYCSTKCKGSSRGRPINYRMRDDSKELVSIGRTGKHHDTPTKTRISVSVKEAIKSGLATVARGQYHVAYKHGQRTDNSPLYRKWRLIYARCYIPNNKAYKYYGGKGIIMCDHWLKDFINFRDWCLQHDYAPGEHLHRKNSDGPYAPDNCIFLDPSTHSKIHAEIAKQKSMEV